MKYEDFLKFLFDRVPSEPGWYFESNFIQLDIDSADYLNFFKRLFEEIDYISMNYDEVTFCMGINYLINNSCGDVCYILLDDNIPEKNRLSCISLMHNIFEKVFAKKCVALKDEKYKSSILPSYHWLCFLWWDIFPRHGVPFKKELLLTDETILETIRRVLLLENYSCKKSAIHGFGHWHSSYPDIVEKILFEDKYAIPETLRELVEKAKSGRLM